MTTPDHTPDDGRTAFIEELSQEWVASGMPRMPARVFAALVASDSGRATAGELAEQLHVSAAAISGAVRYLEQVDMLQRTRPLTSRRDVFSLKDDLWYEALAARNSVLVRWQQVFDRGAAHLGPATPAGERLTEMAEFFRFLHQRMPGLLEEWHEQRKS